MPSTVLSPGPEGRNIPRPRTCEAMGFAAIFAPLADCFFLGHQAPELCLGLHMLPPVSGLGPGIRGRHVDHAETAFESKVWMARSQNSRGGLATLARSANEAATGQHGSPRTVKAGQRSPIQENESFPRTSSACFLPVSRLLSRFRLVTAKFFIVLADRPFAGETPGVFSTENSLFFAGA